MQEMVMSNITENDTIINTEIVDTITSVLETVINLETTSNDITGTLIVLEESAISE